MAYNQTMCLYCDQPIKLGSLSVQLKLWETIWKIKVHLLKSLKPFSKKKSNDELGGCFKWIHFILMCSTLWPKMVLIGEWTCVKFLYKKCRGWPRSRKIYCGVMKQSQSRMTMPIGTMLFTGQVKIQMLKLERKSTLHVWLPETFVQIQNLFLEKSQGKENLASESENVFRLDSRSFLTSFS